MHGEHTRKELLGRHGYKRPIDVARHPAYTGWYRDDVSREQARAKLDLPNDARVYLYFGYIKPYKGVEDLIQAFDALADDQAILVIAGKPMDEAIRDEIGALATGNRRIRTHLAYIPDEAIQDFFRAADIVVFPFQHTQTSGSLMLALTYGCPVIAPAIATLPEYLDGNSSILFNPGIPGDLLRALSPLGKLDRIRTPLMVQHGANDTNVPVVEAEQVVEHLKHHGFFHRLEPYVHRYPHCWRCGTPLVFRLVDEWFISMDELRNDMIAITKQIRWIPSFGLERELDWLRNMHDWMISKKRYWGLALPIWECTACAHFEVIGSDTELHARATRGLDVLDDHTPHRPYIDAVKIPCPHCGAEMSRIPDVGNPWLDAGIVPFSTLSYRKNPEFWRKWYPADWISESFPGQFRNWFYSLLAMATVIDSSPPFMENFGYALLLAEDGKPMHKSSGNMIEFNEAADRIGVDVMRWLYLNHRPENDLLFGYHRGDEVRREFLIPLWNVYSFFVTYARLDGWTPPAGSFDPDYPEGPAPQSANLLDQWVLGRLDQVVNLVEKGVDASDFASATLAVNAFLDDLTNWYVRRSRRRFWKSEADADKNAAYATLYHVLVKLARTLAPFTPFVSEVMYQNLVRGVCPAAHESVHHTRWPQVEAAQLDDSLLEQMALARRVASLGLSARSGANLKVRQPLSKVLVHAGQSVLRPELVEIVEDELNVKAFEFVAEEGQLVRYKVLPDNKLLGPRFGARFPQLRQALAAADPAKVAACARAGMPYPLELDGETVELSPAEVLVSTEPAPGLAVAADKYTTVAIDSTLTPELRREGQARELVRRIQDMRKKAGFNIEDRISTWYQAEGELAEVFTAWGAYIAAETLTTRLEAGAAPQGTYTENHEIDGEDVLISVKN